MSENINEGRHQVKRKYGEYAKIKINENGANVRDAIIKYVGKNYVTEESLYNHLIRLEEDRGGAKINKTKWFKRNTKFFNTFEKNGNKFISLSKYGQRVLEMIAKRDAVPAVNESCYRNIPSLNEWVTVNEILNEDYMDEELVDMELTEADWTEDVKTKWHPPAGLFTTSAENIAKTLKGASKDLQQAMARLNFYINRAGKNLDAKKKKVLDDAKKVLDKLYGKE